jgi:hypothetical protein
MTTNNKMTKFYKKKDEMFADVGYDKPYYFSKDISTDGAFKEFFYCDDIEDVKEILEVDNNIYEIIAENKSRHSYFDLDGTYQSFQKHITDDMYIDDFILREFKVMLEEFKELYGFVEDIDNLTILQGTKPNKISFHIVDKSVVLKNCYECNLYHKKFIEYLIEKDNCLLDLLDKGVYDKDRNFRCINQSKKTKIPYPLKSKSEISDTLVCCKSNNILNIPAAWKISKDKIVKQPEKVVIDNEEVNFYVNKLKDERWIDYKLWIETVWCLMALKVDVDTIHEKSNEIGIDKYNKNDLDSVIKQFDATKKWSLNTLRKWVQEDNEGIEIHFDKNAPVLDENKDNHIDHLKLQNEFDGRVFIDGIGLDDMYNKVSQCIHYIQNGARTFAVYVNSDNQFHITEKLNQIKFTIMNSNDKEKPKPITLERYMIDNPKLFPRYNKIVFKPLGKDLYKHELNVWSGFKAKKVDVIDYEIVNMFINHIKDVWANGNEEYYKYCMWWIANMIQNPDKKANTCIILQGLPGAGKSMPCAILYKQIFGADLSLKVSGLEDITGRFNMGLKGKIAVFGDELQNINGDYHGSFDKLKDLITAEHIICESKGINSFQIENYINYIFTSNHRICVKVEDYDRRYFCLECSNIHRGDLKYVDKFLELCDNQNGGNHIYSYLLQYNDKVDLRAIPMTSFKKELIKNSKPNPIVFIEEGLKDIEDTLGDTEKKKLYDIDINTKKISNENLYNLYINWCSKEGEKVFSKKFLYNTINHLIKIKGQNNTGDRRRWIQF